MEYIRRIFFIIAINCLINITSQQATNIEFKEAEQFMEIEKKKNFTFIASFNHLSNYKYLYIYQKNYYDGMNFNKAIFKIYFKQIQNKDSYEGLNLNYLNSDYSSIDFNSGLFISLSDLKYNYAVIFVNSYEICNFRLGYRYVNEISFPSHFDYTNFQFNQFILEKEGKGDEGTRKIKFTLPHEYNDYLLIISKTSLRNFEIKVENSNGDDNSDKIGYLYPNGCSVFLDRKNKKGNDYYITIKNKNPRNEVLLLGYMHHYEDQIFTNEVVNGIELYIEGNKENLNNLLITGADGMIQYFSIQTFNKNLSINFYTTGNANKGFHEIKEYNSMFPYLVNFSGKMKINFEDALQRSSLYMQYIDYSNIKIAQNSLQALTTGVPKSMTIPGGYSIYHFLPKERESTYFYYYLRPNNNNEIFVSFKSCSDYPENCIFTEKGKVGIIQNIGLWYKVPRNNNELQLIYVYCENDCSYDILMTYEDEDPLFLFPDNNYTKFISDTGEDIFALPVFEFFNSSYIKSLYIDLTVISGKADLTLKDGRNGNVLNYNIIKAGNKQSCIISREEFLSNDINYFKKEIYAYVKQSNNYKNTFYHIIYGNSGENIKPLSNYIVYNELLTVDYPKTFSFTNKNKLFISISSQLCQSKITIDKTAKSTAYNHLYQLEEGTHSIQINIINDGTLCKANTEDKVSIFTYDANSEVLLSENTLINTTISSTVSFLHLFKTNEDANADNSFNVEIEKYDENDLSFSYQIKKISFDDNTESSDISGQKITSCKSKYISNKQIKKYCGKLKENEVCSLTMTFKLKSSSSQISLNLKNNNHIKARELTNRSLIASVNNKTAQYFYIDVDKNSNLELLINSYWRDLKFHYQIFKKQEEENILPLKEPYKTGQQYTIQSSEFKDCSDYCRLYIGVISHSSEGDEVSSSFYIGYRQDNENKNVFNLPLNYFTQYTLNKGNEINFYVLNPTSSAKLLFELYSIKKKEDDSTIVTADISGAGNSFQLSSSDGQKSTTVSKGIIIIKIKINDESEKATFRLKVSSTGSQMIIPMTSSYGEKCLIAPCYYLVEDLSLDNEEKAAYFYIPDSESSVINYLSLKYDEEISITGTFTPSTGRIARPNWIQLPISDKEHFLILKMEKAGTIIPSYYNNPNEVTLNYGEKRMFIIRKGNQDNMKIKINKFLTDNYKCKIKLHSIMGNGVFKCQGHNYPLGFENSYKEDISIIFNNNNKFDMDLEVVNRRFEKVDNNNDFVFTIEYTIETGSEIKYPINFDKMNSFNFYKSGAGFGEFSFYLNRNEITSQGLDMNIKIYSSSNYDIKSYFADVDKNYKTDINDLDNKIKTFIEGAGFTFSKLEVTSDVLGKYAINDYPYIYIQIKPKDKSTSSNSVQIDLYPYDMINTNHYLARDQLYIQKLPRNTENYQLFLGKSEINYGDDAKIYFIHPLSDKYKKAIAQTDNGKTNITEDEPDLVSLITDETYGFYKYKLDLGTDKKQKYLSFNIYTDENNRESNEDSFIFTYQNPHEGEDYLYWPDKLEFNVTGKEKNLEFGVNGFKPKYETTGANIFIINAYKVDDVKNCLDLGDDYLSIYLLFNKKPAYTIYQELTLNSDTGTKKKIEDTKIKAGKYYFTGVSVLKDNGREQYIGYPGKSYEFGSSSLLGDLLDYMKNHVFASILIIIIILFILGIMVNICRAERKGGRVSSVKVELDGQLMDDKGES